MPTGLEPAALRGHARLCRRDQPPQPRALRRGGEADRKALAHVEKRLKEIVTVMEDGGYSRLLMMRLRELEAKQDELTERLSRAPADIPDLHPNVAGIYRRKVKLDPIRGTTGGWI
jgi:hypothetical protein